MRLERICHVGTNSKIFLLDKRLHALLIERIVSGVPSYRLVLSTGLAIFSRFRMLTSCITHPWMAISFSGSSESFAPSALPDV